MPLPLDLLRNLERKPPGEAWAAAFDYAWEICRAPLPGKARTEITDRTKRLSAIDLFLATAGWDLWRSYQDVVPRTAAALAAWWKAQDGPKAVLILDGLSLREAPWLLEGATERGYRLHQARATAAELPADTTAFANALGLPSRAALENDGAPKNHRLNGARTETGDLPWEDCEARITPAPCWLLWHHWPDNRLHDLDGHGKGLDLLVDEAREKLTSDAFWELIERLTTGRRLVITAPHGYAVSGGFPAVASAEQAKYLKRVYKAGRFAPDAASDAGFVPPIDMAIETPHGRHRFVLGRRKWKAQGGYPTLTHGGLSLLEVAVPFIEIAMPGKAGSARRESSPSACRTSRRSATSHSRTSRPSVSSSGRTGQARRPCSTSSAS